MTQEVLCKLHILDNGPNLAHLSFVVPHGLQRLAHRTVRHLQAKQDIDVSVQLQDDDRVAIVLPAQWAYLFLAYLEATSRQVHEQLERAMNEARMRQAQIDADMGKAAVAWESNKQEIRQRYLDLCESMPRNAAIQQLKAESGEQLTATLLRDIVRGAEREHARARRTEHITTLYNQGHTVGHIAKELGVSTWTVRHTLLNSHKEDGDGQPAALGTGRNRATE